jgi:hypothetical protein
MTRKQAKIFLCGAALALLAGCAPDLRLNDAQYWERANTTDSTYMEGPKAQQMLDRDVARCIVELRELNNLGEIRAVTPGDNNPNPPDPSTPGGNMAQWDTPERNGYLRAEHSDYHDFETCMQTKGWEREEHLPYDVSQTARANYLATILHQKYQAKQVDTTPPASHTQSGQPDVFGNLNN